MRFSSRDLLSHNHHREKRKFIRNKHPSKPETRLRNETSLFNNPLRALIPFARHAFVASHKFSLGTNFTLFRCSIPTVFFAK